MSSRAVRDGVPGPLRIEAWPEPGPSQVRIIFDASVADEESIKRAVVEPIYDDVSRCWNMSPFVIQGYAPWMFQPQFRWRDLSQQKPNRTVGSETGVSNTPEWPDIDAIRCEEPQTPRRQVDGKRTGCVRDAVVSLHRQPKDLTKPSTCYRINGNRHSGGWFEAAGRPTKALGSKNCIQARKTVSKTMASFLSTDLAALGTWGCLWAAGCRGTPVLLLSLECFGTHSNNTSNRSL